LRPTPSDHFNTHSFHHDLLQEQLHNPNDSDDDKDGGYTVPNTTSGSRDSVDEMFSIKEMRPFTLHNTIHRQIKTKEKHQVKQEKHLHRSYNLLPSRLYQRK